MNNSKIFCPQCGSNNITFNFVSNVITKNKKHSILWWLLVGWWWVIVKWTTMFPIALFMFILKCCGVRKKETKVEEKTMCVCQCCGHTFERPNYLDK